MHGVLLAAYCRSYDFEVLETFVDEADLVLGLGGKAFYCCGGPFPELLIKFYLVGDRFIL